MATIHALDAVRVDPVARRRWRGLSAPRRDALRRSWRADARPDPVRAIARRAAAFLDACAVEPGQAHSDSEPSDLYEYLVDHFPHPSLWPVAIHGDWVLGWGEDGIFWPVRNGRVDRAACSLEQHALLSMYEGNA